MTPKDAAAALESAREKLDAHLTPPPAITNFFYVAFGGQCFMGATSRDEDVVKPIANLLAYAGGRVPGIFPIFFQASLFGQMGGSGKTI